MKYLSLMALKDFSYMERISYTARRGTKTNRVAIRRGRGEGDRGDGRDRTEPAGSLRDRRDGRSARAHRREGRRVVLAVVSEVRTYRSSRGCGGRSTRRTASPCPARARSPWPSRRRQPSWRSGEKLSSRRLVGNAAVPRFRRAVSCDPLWWKGCVVRALGAGEGVEWRAEKGAHVRRPALLAPRDPRSDRAGRAIQPSSRLIAHTRREIGAPDGGCGDQRRARHKTGTRFERQFRLTHRHAAARRVKLSVTTADAPDRVAPRRVRRRTP